MVQDAGVRRGGEELVAAEQARQRQAAEAAAELPEELAAVAV
jgi:hypothetical protein